MNAFHARGPLKVPGLGQGLFDVLFEGNYADHVVNATHYEVTHRATGSHADGAGTIEAVDNGPKLDAGRPLARAALAAGRALHRGDSADLQQPRRQLSPRRRLALRAQRPRRPLRAADRSDVGLDARRCCTRITCRSMSSISAPSAARAVLAGNARWTPEESWDLQGAVTDFDPGTAASRLQRRARLPHEGQRRAVRQRQLRLLLRQPLRPAARQFRERRRAHHQAGRGLDLRHGARCARAPPRSPSMATSDRRARSTWPSASTPTTWGCWPRARAARCTRAAGSPVRRARRWSSSRPRARTSSTTT